MCAVLRFVLLAWLLAPLLAAAQPAEPVPRPEVKVGDRWTYRASAGYLDTGVSEFEIRVTLVDDKSIAGFATRKSDGKEFDAIWTPEWNSVSNIDGMAYRPSTGLLRFPLAVGNRHSASYEAERPRDGKGITRPSLTTTVADWETIEVPAGKFRTLRIEASYDGVPNGPHVILWYAPEVKRHVRLVVQRLRANREEVLLGYKLN